MSKVAIIAKIVAQEGKRAELATALQANLKIAEGEAGTEKYILHEDAAAPDVLWFYEIYTDQESLIAHGSGEEFKAVGRTLAPLMAGRPEITFLTPIGGKGL
jgi:quinol monooxygenase YgiN